MGYQDYTPMANKFLLPDGSITTFSNVEVYPPNAARALLYNQRASAAAKWLMPDGSIVSGMPVVINGIISDVDHISFNTNTTSEPTVKGDLYWDKQDNTLSLVVSNTGVVLQIGQEMYITAVNKTDATIPNGSVVFVSGATGNRPKIELAINTNYIDSTKVIGITTEDILKNAEGVITINGLVRGLNTNAYDEGDCLYLSSVAGQLTKTKPVDGLARIIVGMVIKAHVTDGWICIRIHEDKYMFGDIANGNYSLFESNGILVAKGSASTWRDEYVGGLYFVPTGANAPDEVQVTIAGVVTKKYGFDGNNTAESLNNTFEIPHDMAVTAVNAGTTTIEFHIHIAPSTNGTGVCRFTVDWCLIKVQGAPIAGTQLVITQPILANQQFYNLIVGANLPLPVGGFAIGDLIEFTLTRTPTNAADTYTADILLYKCAMHVPLDTLGSRQRYIK